MKLKGRLITAFLIMLAMPILLVSAAAGTIVRFQMKSINESYDIEANTFQVITNPIQILNRLTRGVYNEIKLTALMNPERLENTDYIYGLNQELKDKYSFITIRKGKDFLYSGNPVKLKMVYNSLPQFGAYNTDIDGGMYIAGKNPFLVKSQDFYFSDGEEGTIFVVTDLNILVPQIKAVATQGIISFFVIILFTAIILIYWVYYSIIKPLNILRIATNQIRDGDLNYSVSSDSSDEIGELCRDFEEMRIRLKELIESRLQYEEDIKEMVSNISHDLKTPLTAIKGYSEGLLDGVADTPQKQEKYLKTIYTKANDMSVLVDELSFYAMIDSNTIPYAFKEINLHEFFGDCIEDYSLDLEVKNIKIEYVNNTDHSITVIADGEQLKRVINNIIGNSVKYLDKKEGKIQTHIQEAGEYVQIDVEDNGSGIHSEDLLHIFDRFYRADASRNSNRGGSGLGLAISKKIIEDHGGKIWAKSELGMGTTILFTLRKSNKSI